MGAVRRGKRKVVKLTPKQKRFVDEYLIDLNATQAAIRAGYSENTATETGYENLTKPHIKKIIDERMKEREQRTEITQDMVLKGLAQVAFSDVRNMFTSDGNLLDIHDLPDDAAMAIAGIEVVTVRKEDREAKEGSPVEYTNKIKSNDRMKALELLGKHMKMFTEKHEHTGADGESIKLEHQSVVFNPVGGDET